MITRQRLLINCLLLAVFAFLLVPTAKADAVSEWNKFACDLAEPAGLGPPQATRALAMMHTAIYEAVNAVTKKYPQGEAKIEAAPGASVDAAVAAAARATLLKLVPAKAQDIESFYQNGLSKVPDGSSRTDGIAAGERAAAMILTTRMDDGSGTLESYRPYTIAGVYVPTMLPVMSHWSARKPWLLTSVSQFRPGPPPDLKSELWARDYNEVKALGRKEKSTRTAEQTDIAQFWEATLPAIYHGLIRSVTDTPDREITRNARLFMTATQATDDALIAIFDAKYHYNFWRPVTAIRNGDIDGNDATERDPSWTPFINTPMHPEYPCAHCILSGAIGTVLQAEIGNATVPVLGTTSGTARNAQRTWMKLEDFIQEVANGRIYDGVHYRNSTEVGTAMGRKIGQLAASRHLGK